jgi:hypothetical protein
MAHRQEGNDAKDRKSEQFHLPWTTDRPANEFEAKDDQ